ncbi:MAG: hypothetical protein M1830_002750 [Pleopsidium flavum]|nr:MAG: hypothetical protein M1830_002750 [Pleopsidium flavum]
MERMKMTKKKKTAKKMKKKTEKKKKEGVLIKSPIVKPEKSPKKDEGTNRDVQVKKEEMSE